MSLWRELTHIHRPRDVVKAIDPWLFAITAALLGLGLVTMYSAAFDFSGRFDGQLRNVIVASVALCLVAWVRPKVFLWCSIPVYVIGVILLIGVEFFGIVRNGSQRWLALGPIVVQPSEFMKLGVPMAIAAYFQWRGARVRAIDHVVGLVLLAVPVALILNQPDLGTSLLIMGGGLFVLFFAGLSFRLLIPLAIAGVVGLSTLLIAQDTLCEPEVDWIVLQSYQKTRVCTLLDPTRDPLGAGFHTIQSSIAVGSGGWSGKGFMQGTQTHLDFIPERTSDFIFAVYAEEFGFVGGLGLLALYLLLVARGLWIAGSAATFYERLTAGALTMVILIYAVVNLGMVIGLLPVVGLPLPFISYGGTALLTLGVAIGMLMSMRFEQKASRERRPDAFA